MWQRLRLLRVGKHPKDKIWLGDPIPEPKWSTQTVSEVITAISETRQRENAREAKSGPAASTSTATKISKLEQVKLRIRAKLHCAESGEAESSTLSTCTASSSSSTVSRFGAMRRRIKTKEVESKGVLHVNE